MVRLTRKTTWQSVRQGIAVTCLASGLLFAAPGAARGAEAAEATFLYGLSGFTGTLPLEWVALALDEKAHEIYVGDPGSRSVGIFNEQGMETFRFGDDERFGRINDLALPGNGDILILSQEAGGGSVLLHCDYRGQILRRTPLPNRAGDLPFSPSRMVLHGERLFFADYGAMLAAEADRAGQLLKVHDLGAALGLSRTEVANSGLGGFAVDAEGNLLFTLPAQFTAHRLRPDGQLDSFGQPGSAPGRFGVAAGIAADRDGRLYVVDTLRCVVLVFDQDLRFITEFGARDTAPGGLIAPKELSVAGDGKIYVTQRGKRGVNVYRLTLG